MIWDASDANPMHRRIPAEVVSRRARPEPRKQVEEKKVAEEEVFVDLKSAIALKPDARPKWLGKAISMVESGKVSATELFDIVTSRKFVSSLPDRVLRRIVAIVFDCQNIFSDKQRRYLLSSECVLTREPTVMPVAKVDDPQEERKEDLDAAEADSALERVLKGAGALPAPAVASSMPAEKQAPPAEKKVAPLTVMKPKQVPKAEASTSQWEVAQDEAAVRRQQKEMKELAIGSSRREEKLRRESMFEDLVNQDPMAKVAAQKNNVEDDADALLNRVFARQPEPAPEPDSRSARGKKDKKDRGRSRSRSISSRTARKIARADREKKARGKGEWQRSADTATGSRAIFMHKDFQEDLPHMPRPNQAGTRGVSARSPVRALRGGAESASRSRSRPRRR